MLSFGNGIGNLGETLEKQKSNSHEIQEDYEPIFKFEKKSGILHVDLKGLPFWIWDERDHKIQYIIKKGNCCFNHIIGLPRDNKTGRFNILFPYQKELLDALFTKQYLNDENDAKKWKHVVVKKATGMAFTETSIRIMAYLPCRFPERYRDSQMAIVTGINYATSKRIMKRMKNLFYTKLGIVFDTNDRVLNINGCVIEAYPAVNPDTYRSLPNPSFLLGDELAFYPENLNIEVIDALERYIAKSNPFILLGSTANKPGDLLETLEKQERDKSMYKLLMWLVDKGIGYIYTKQDIEIAKQSDSYPREYLGEYRGLKGNLFPKNLLEYASYESDLLEIHDYDGVLIRSITRDIKNELRLQDIIQDPRYMGVGNRTSIGIDPAFNSSNFAIVVNKKVGDIVYAVKEVELHAPSFEEAIDVVKDLCNNEYPDYYPKMYIDGSAVAFIRALKKEIGEDIDYHRYNNEELNTLMLSPSGMKVCPISFSKYGDRMNYFWKQLLELGMYRISKDVTPHLYTAMNTAQYSEEKNRFDKKLGAYDDLFDAGRLCINNFQIGNLGVLYV